MTASTHETSEKESFLGATVELLVASALSTSSDVPETALSFLPLIQGVVGNVEKLFDGMFKVFLQSV